jgi:hypothetical protein
MTIVDSALIVGFCLGTLFSSIYFNAYLKSIENENIKKELEE